MSKRIVKKREIAARKWVVSPEEKGMTLHAFLRKKCPDAPSVKALKKAIDGKYCTVNGVVETFSSHPLKLGSRVSLDFRAFRERRQELFVLYEDEDLLICDKPAGVVSEEKQIKARLPADSGKLELVHRLDKETSGVLILARKHSVREQMVALFRAHQVVKGYLALVDGLVKADHGKIDYPLKRVLSKSGQAMMQIAQNEEGITALTEWVCLARGENASLLLLVPRTGRTHQLRVHLNALGHPLLGDLHYGKRFRAKVRAARHLLHAYAIAFPHPTQEKNVEVMASIPDDFREACSEAHIDATQIQPLARRAWSQF